jgi:hypothetical protein
MIELSFILLCFSRHEARFLEMQWARPDGRALAVVAESGPLRHRHSLLARLDSAAQLERTTRCSTSGQTITVAHATCVRPGGQHWRVQVEAAARILRHGVTRHRPMLIGRASQHRPSKPDA